MDPSTTFYQVLTSTSFTLLGIWVGVMQFAHGGWRSDPARHATTLHVTLKFFLPGSVGLVSLLGAAHNGGLVWRVTFVLGGLIGLAESVHFLLRGVGRPVAVRRLALADPVLYLAVVTVAFLPAGALAVTPLQAEGLVTGLVFVTGLVGVWIALSERAPGPDPESAPATPAPATAELPAASSAPPAEPLRPGTRPRPGYRRPPGATTRRPQPAPR
jgi:hypothetical protein